MSDRQQNINIPRRNILQMIGWGTATLALGGLVKATESFFSEKEKIVTDDATFYPNYELHNEHPDMSNKIREIGKEHDQTIYFRECLVRPGFINETNKVILTAPYMAWDKQDKEYGTLATSDEISALHETNSSISIEGFTYNPKKIIEDYKKVDDNLNNFAKDAAVSTGVNILNTLTGKDVNSQAVIDNIGSLLALGWASGSSLEKIASDLDSLPYDPKTEKIKNALHNTSAFISHLHPENMAVFFRNLLGARKMQTLAKSMKEYNKDSNPGIVYCYGGNHRGIEDLLTLGPNITLTGFSLYKNETLSEIINENGGIREFCKMLVIPINSADVNECNERKYLLDNELMAYLENRLGKENPAA